MVVSMINQVKGWYQHNIKRRFLKVEKDFGCINCAHSVTIPNERFTSKIVMCGDYSLKCSSYSQFTKK